MTRHQFRLLTRRAQLLVALTQGTFLAQRWAANAQLKLYHVAGEGSGFFAEIGLDEAQECFVVLRSFKSSVPLEAYVCYVQLPEA